MAWKVGTVTAKPVAGMSKFHVEIHPKNDEAEEGGPIPIDQPGDGAW